MLLISGETPRGSLIGEMMIWLLYPAIVPICSHTSLRACRGMSKCCTVESRITVYIQVFFHLFFPPYTVLLDSIRLFGMNHYNPYFGLSQILTILIWANTNIRGDTSYIAIFLKVFTHSLKRRLVFTIRNRHFLSPLSFSSFVHRPKFPCGLIDSQYICIGLHN